MSTVLRRQPLLCSLFCSRLPGDGSSSATALVPQWALPSSNQLSVSDCWCPAELLVSAAVGPAHKYLLMGDR